MMPASLSNLDGENIAIQNKTKTSFHIFWFPGFKVQIKRDLLGCKSPAIRSEAMKSNTKTLTTELLHQVDA